MESFYFCFEDVSELTDGNRIYFNISDPNWSSEVDRMLADTEKLAELVSSVEKQI